MNTKYLREERKEPETGFHRSAGLACGIAIAAHDLIDAATTKHGLYKLEMWVDDTPLLSSIL